MTGPDILNGMYVQMLEDFGILDIWHKYEAWLTCI